MEQSRGLTFAEQQLRRHGWEEGRGLGRRENGISEAIKVKMKADKGGVGHSEGDQFSFCWWDHVFNKASARVHVDTQTDGVKLRSAAEDDDECLVSSKRPTKSSRGALYGRFIKSGTLLGGQEQPEPKISSSSSSEEDEDEDHKLDLSSVTKLSDAELMKVCGGRTAHRGARHGLTMSAKLARLEQQEAQFMARYGHKGAGPAGGAGEQHGRTSTEESQAAVCAEEEVSEGGKCQHPAKRKRKKIKTAVQNGETSISDDTRLERKKKRKQAEEKLEEPSEDATAEAEEETTKRKKKKKKKKAEMASEEEQTMVDEGTNKNLEKKRRKKRKKKKEESDDS